MGSLGRWLGTATAIDVMRADIYMEYHPLSGSGSAAVDWVPLESNDPNLRPFLVALLYARILTVHKETRHELWRRTNEVSRQNVRDEGRTGFHFGEWTLQVGFGAPTQKIWPFQLYDNPAALGKASVYQATLQAIEQPKARASFGIHLKMALGQERILAPVSALLAMSSYAQSTDQEGRYELAVLLWQLNEYYGSPDRVRIGGEPEALAAATTAIRAGNLRIP